MPLETVETILGIKGRIIVKAFGLSPKRDNLAFYVLIKNQVYILKLNTKDSLSNEKLKRLSNKLVLLSGIIINKYIIMVTSVTEISNLRN